MYGSVKEIYTCINIFATRDVSWIFKALKNNYHKDAMALDQVFLNWFFLKYEKLIEKLVKVLKV